jgi:epoxyqueuosine reductase QueG
MVMISGLEKIMKREGIDIFGTSDVSEAVPEAFKSVLYAVTLGIRLSDAVMDGVKEGPTKNYFHHYRTANAFLDMCAMKCVIYLQRKGHMAVAIPASQTTNDRYIAGDFQHKTAANLAGLGFIGKSALFISNKFGPRVRLATVLTDLKLESGKTQQQKCGDCDLCAGACPCGAITGRAWEEGIEREELIDAALCSKHMKQKYEMIGRGAVCGICVAVCPLGNQNNRHKEEA